MALKSVDSVVRNLLKIVVFKKAVLLGVLKSGQKNIIKNITNQIKPEKLEKHMHKQIKAKKL
tara:strand:+ start:225 stop:410 length:186 start_codon:yes stop_codon:yes gene_type:complete